MAAEDDNLSIESDDVITSRDHLPVTGDRVKQSDDNNKTEEPIKCELDVWKAPDGDWGWFIVLGSFLVHVISGKMNVIFINLVLNH